MSEQTLVVTAYAGILPLLLFGFGFSFFAPEKVVSLWARYYRWLYRDLRGMSDTQIQGVKNLFPAQWLFGDMLGFITDGVKTPEKYAELVALMRVMGGVFLFITGSMTILLLVVLLVKAIGAILA